MNHLLIIDGKYLAYVALYSRRWLALNGKPIGVVYGWWSDLFNAVRRLKPTHLSVAWDSRHLYRKEISSIYKQGRQEDPDGIKELEQFFPQVESIQSMIKQANIAQSEIDGLEADDLIALLCRRFSDKVTIYSSDNDLFQLLSDRVSMYSKRKFTTPKTLWDEHGCTPSQWALIKALAGCSGDNVVGVNGIGVKTAVKIIKNEHKRKHLGDYQDVVERNLQLVRLPYPLMNYRNVSVGASCIGQIDWKLLNRHFLALDFKTLLDIDISRL